jgi:hypothetical protein
MFSDVLQKFVERSPATVTVRGLLEPLRNPQALDRWFKATARARDTRDIRLSSLAGLMLRIVCRTRASVHAAYRHARIAASSVSVDAKLRGVELTTSQGLVRHIAREARTVIATMNGGRPGRLPGYRLKYLDGNGPAASEHRLKPLRTMAAGPLPGKSPVVVDPQPGLAVDVFPCADGHARERSLLEAVADTVAPGEVRVAGRTFRVAGFLHAIDRRAAFCIIRQHGGLATEPLEPRRVGRSDTGEVHEHAVQVDSPTGERRSLRRITVPLKRKTRNGDTAPVIPTHLPIAAVDAMTIAACYRARRGIETAFQKPERHTQLRDRDLGLPPGRPVRSLPGAGGVQPPCRGHGGAAHRSPHPGDRRDRLGVLPGRRDRHHHDRSRHRRPRAGMGFARTGQPATLRRLAARPRRPRGSAQAPQDHARSDETTHPAHSAQRSTPCLNRQVAPRIQAVGGTTP